MTIDRVGPVDPLQNLKKAKGPEKPRKNEGEDSIQVSEEARSKAEVYQATELAKGAPEIRWELVEEIKKRLQDPNYLSDKVLDGLAQKLMEYFEIT
jgi:negative regulator of flagellin synthesis FlgM